MVLIDSETRVEIATYLNRSKVIFAVAAEPLDGKLTRAKRVHLAYLTAWRALSDGMRGKHRAEWVALLRGPRRALDGAIANLIRASLLTASRQAA